MEYRSFDVAHPREGSNVWTGTSTHEGSVHGIDDTVHTSNQREADIGKISINPHVRLRGADGLRAAINC